MQRRDCLFSLLAVAHCLIVKRMHGMSDVTTVNVRVIAHWIIQRFSGEALVASPKPRYVVALLIEGTKAPYRPIGTDVTFSTHRVAFFAIESIVRVFAESDVLGKDYRMEIQQIAVGDSKRYIIHVIG
jgi:hypothetical protein